MKTPARNRIAPAITLLAAIGWNSIASASSIAPMFNVEDLGAGYQLQTDSSGYANSVTGANGSVYAFDKSPTTSIDVRYTSPGVGGYMPNLGQWYYGGLHAGGYIQGTLQNGSLIGGYFSDQISGTGFTFHVPLGLYIDGTWHDEWMPPVSDMNAHGEIVGTSVIGAYSGPNVPTYAAFSTSTGETHDMSNIGNSQIADNLNNYIASSLGINLTQGLKIDDLGRIIAVGSNGDDYLLSPLALGPPSPTPEPTTFALLIVASAGLAVRRRSLRR